ncbi:DUF3472 domain-containing protein [Bowmanella pacifica]|uniref:DUF5077 domain-containing protein n=1 Tax=Bowmanella pacifica TaxID=502051 RepID=A0A917Z0Y2_9ALTE|nr:DUF3472 domain-containing protein [Bowmanella pacifica]GGO69898.1 hypothetical protein GCM10010982_22130 [Bowmanella pacifica]
MRYQHKFTMPLILLLCSCGGNNESHSPVTGPQGDKNSITLPSSQPVEIPLSFNTWVEDNPEASLALVANDNSAQLNWQDSQHSLLSYFALDRADTLTLALSASSTAAQRLAISLGEQETEITLQKGQQQTYPLFEVKLASGGYQQLNIRSLDGRSGQLPTLHHLALWPGNSNTKLYFLDNDNPYWGRRGPSVHFSYDMPLNRDIEWFYSEITVPSGQDVPGSYYMANGFGEGYFGIQVNSEVERRVLFSIWSPFQTDDPSQIPPEQRIQLLGKGDGVYTGEFGNEGSGGQSYLKYPWLVDTTYSFLLKVTPAVDNSTDYTAWFKPQSEDKWRLIASFKRPQTDTYATRLHSFLENFLTQYGNQSRWAWYQNQWAKDKEGTWHELTQARFTVDATGRAEDRLDFQGDSMDNGFILKNGGFTYPPTPADTRFERQTSGQAPKIDFSALPQP